MAEFSDLLQRNQNAYKHLVDTLKAAGELNDSQARSAAAYYLKHRLATLDNTGGRSMVKHGAFLARDVVRRSLDAK